MYNYIYIYIYNYTHDCCFRFRVNHFTSNYIELHQNNVILNVCSATLR